MSIHRKPGTWEPSQTDAYLEALRRLAGRPHSKRFNPILTKEQKTMEFSEAVEKYRDHAGDQYQQPDPDKSRERGACWFLSDAHGHPVALVDDNGCLFGRKLRQWFAVRHDAATQIQDEAEALPRR